MITQLSSISPLLATLSKSAFSALSALCLGAIFHNAESKKIKASSLEIPERDKFESYKTLMKLTQYSDDQQKGKIYDFSELNFNPVDLLKQLGTQYNNGSEDKTRKDTNFFKNSPLIEYAVFHVLDLYKILDYCDFKSNPQITKNSLIHQDVNGLNFINHAMRNRVALGNKLTAKIVDIYVDNLDDKTLLKSLDKFVLTLPPEQFKKIADKVGIKNLQKIIRKKELNEKIIRQEISKYHSPEIFRSFSSFLHEDLDGYDKSTVAKKLNTPLEVLNSVKDGNSVQIGKIMMSEIISKHEEIRKKLISQPNSKKIMFINEASFVDGILATRETFEALKTKEDKIVFKEMFDTSKTAVEDFVENLKANRKYLEQQKNLFSASRVGDTPSSKPSSPEHLPKTTEQEL